MPVPGAPDLGPNPYVGAAASAGSAAVSLLNGLRAAHNQQVQLAAQQQRQAQQDFMDQQKTRADLLSSGKARPYEPFMRSDSGLIMNGVRNPDETADAKSLIGFPALGDGAALVMLTPEEQEQHKLIEGNSTTLSDSLAAEANAAGLNVKAGQRYNDATLRQINTTVDAYRAKNKPVRQDIDTSGDFRDQAGNPAAVMINPENGEYTPLHQKLAQAAPVTARSAAPISGVRPGSGNPHTGNSLMDGVLPGGQPGAGISFAKKPAKEQAPHIVQFTDKSGDVHEHATDPESGKELWSRTYKGEGKPDDFDAREREINQRAAERKEDRQDARTSREQDKREKAADAASAAHEKLQGREHDHWYLRQIYSDLADPTKSPNGTTVSEPRYNESSGQFGPGSEITMSDGRRALYGKLAEQERTKALDYQKRAKSIRQKQGWGEFSTQAQPQQPRAQQTQQPQQAAPAGGQAQRLYSPQEITDWAKANGKDPADALARAKKNKILKASAQ